MAQRSAEAEAKCFNLSSHSDIRQCLIAENSESEQRLRQASIASINAIKGWDEETSSKNRSVAANRIAIAAFQRIRESQCKFIASLSAGGNGAEDRRLLCKIELNSRHSKDLSEAVLSIK